MSHDFHDRMIDQLLREILSGDRPRDMTTRVLAQARIVDRFKRRIWLSAGSALAASIALVLGLMLWPRPTPPADYPNPTGDQIVTQDELPLQRGSVVSTEAAEGTLNLGQYVAIKMFPQTSLNIGGSKYQEKVILNQGELDVDVTKNKGQFDVAIGPATVHVTGTRFRVRVGEENTPTALVKKLFVNVKEGSVEVQNLPGMTGTQTVAAGQSRDFPLKTVLKAANAGAFVGAQQGARIGRGLAPNTLLPRALTNPATPLPTIEGPGTTSRGPSPSVVPLTSNSAAGRGGGVQMMTTPARGERVGHVLRSGNIFYLQTGDGNFFMFERSAVTSTNQDWLNIPAEQYTRVNWVEGVVTQVQKYAPSAASQPK